MIRHRRPALVNVLAHPLQFTVAVAGLVLSLMNLVPPGPTLRGWDIAVIAMLGLGSAVYLVGRCLNRLNTESAGLALLIGSFMFLTLRNLPHAHDSRSIAGVLLNFGALAIGYGLRLYVVRKLVRRAGLTRHRTHGG